MRLGLLWFDTSFSTDTRTTVKKVKMTIAGGQPGVKPFPVPVLLSPTGETRNPVQILYI